MQDAQVTKSLLTIVKGLTLSKNIVTAGVFLATSGFKLKKTVASLVFVRFSSFFYQNVGHFI